MLKYLCRLLPTASQPAEIGRPPRGRPNPPPTTGLSGPRRAAPRFGPVGPATAAGHQLGDENLNHQLAEATRGERFLLQGGDCSESFDDCESSAIASKLKILLQMSLVLVQGGKKRVTRIGRFAGQYAKPRSADTETHKGLTLAQLPRRHD